MRDTTRGLLCLTTRLWEDDWTSPGICRRLLAPSGGDPRLSAAGRPLQADFSGNTFLGFFLLRMVLLASEFVLLYSLLTIVVNSSLVLFLITLRDYCCVSDMDIKRSGGQ